MRLSEKTVLFKSRRALAVLAAAACGTVVAGLAEAPSSVTCVACHKKINPGIVTDWEHSRHSEVEVGCADCHGDGHQGTNDVAKALIPTPDTCGECHETQVKQFKGGKHAAAWAAMEAISLPLGTPFGQRQRDRSNSSRT